MSVENDNFYTESKLKILWHTNKPKIVADEYNIKYELKKLCGRNVCLFPKKESDEITKKIEDYVKNFNGSEEQARRQFMVDIRRKNMSFESRGMISFLQLGRNLGLARDTIKNYVDYLNIPFHEEIDPIGHVKVKVISLDDVNKIEDFNKLNAKKIMTDSTKIEKYGSIEEAEKQKVQKMLKTKSEWSDEQREQFHENCRIAQKKVFSDSKRKEEILNKRNETKIEKYGSWENYVNSMVENQRKTILKNYPSMKEYKEICRNSLLKNLESRGITEEEYNKQRCENALKTLSEKYGMDITNINQIPNWKEKVQECWKNKSVEELNEITDKARKTLFENYGVLNGSDLVTHNKIHYNGIVFDSSWELMVYLYFQDNDISFEYHRKNFYISYECEGKLCRYYPDFIVGDKIYEVKGDQYYDENGIMINLYDLSDKKPQYKQKCMEEHGVIVIREKDMDKYIENFKKNHSDINIESLYKSDDFNKDVTLFDM